MNKSAVCASVLLMLVACGSGDDPSSGASAGLLKTAAPRLGGVASADDPGRGCQR